MSTKTVMQHKVKMDSGQNIKINAIMVSKIIDRIQSIIKTQNLKELSDDELTTELNNVNIEVFDGIDSYLKDYYQNHKEERDLLIDRLTQFKTIHEFVKAHFDKYTLFIYTSDLNGGYVFRITKK